MDNPFEGMSERMARAALETAEHRAACRLEPCPRCERFVCVIGCGAKVERENMRCRGCVKRERREAWGQRALAAVPRGFSDSSLESEWLVRLVGQAGIETAKGALAESRVVAVGPPGSGKTSLLAAMLVAADFPTRPGPVWVSAHQLAKARTLHPLGEGEAPIIAQALDASVLVVDELGGEDQRYASAVAEVLFERHAEAKPTWVTTGVTPKEISARYGGGIARRVFEGATVFRLIGRLP